LGVPLRCLRCGYTLVELLIVITVLGVLSGVMIASYEPTVSDQLTSVARVVADDINFTRTLAVMNGSEYQLAFAGGTDQYTLKHVGANASLNILPSCPFGQSSDPATARIAVLSDLPSVSVLVELAGVTTSAGARSTNGTLVFDSLGSLSSGVDTKIWLVAGPAGNRRYISVEINGVTGLTSIGDIQSQASN